MNASVRIFTNTIVLYVKIIVSLVVGLFLTREVLATLGVDDFGIYNLIAGIIALLAFLESSLRSSTQRYLSLALGQKSRQAFTDYFSASLLLHLFLAIILFLIFYGLSFFLFDGFLNIPIERIEAAKTVFKVMVISSMLTILVAPFNAVINAYEDIWYLGLMQTFSAILKLGVLFLFKYVDFDSLILYSVWMLTVVVFEFLAALIWCVKKYSVFKYWKSHISKLRDILGFTGWNTLGTFAVVARNQGVAVVLNKFLGTSINAVWGLANQVDGYLIVFANSITASVAPQIVKSYGEKNYDKLRFLTVFSSKITFFMSAIFALPALVELPFILKIWLKEVPLYAEIYCQLILVVFLICELYPGLTKGIEAVGNIKWSKLLSSLVVVLPIPIGVVLFKMGYVHYTICMVMIVAQIASLAIAMYWSWKLYKINVKQYVCFILRATLLFGGLFLLATLLKQWCGSLAYFYQFIFVNSVVLILFVAVFWGGVLNKAEKIMVGNMVRKILKR